jgi:hypothetical protein
VKQYQLKEVKVQQADQSLFIQWEYILDSEIMSFNPQKIKERTQTSSSLRMRANFITILDKIVVEVSHKGYKKQKKKRNQEKNHIKDKEVEEMHF